ncbi:MAG: porin family protein [Deltaproteobacteria bacterium]|nr:porin family protein [Deltaproteobacteria bacterium]
MFRIALGVTILASLARVAAADVCVTLDEARDTLAPEDRKAAMISFGQALSKNGVAVTNANCTETYTVYNVKLGDTITVYVNGPTGNREARASKLDELPLVYEQIAHSLVTGQPLVTGGGNIDRTNATNDQMAPRRAASDNLKFVRLGYGAVTGSKTTTGPAFGIGYRYELDALAIEVSAFNLIVASDSSSSGNGAGVTGDWIRLSAYRYQNPIGDDSVYFGGGVGWGANAVYDSSTHYAGSGIEGHAIAGYEMLRSSTIRIFGEADLTLPFYKSNGTDPSGNSSSRYIPSMSLQIGIGWGKSNTVAVVNR